MEVFGKELFEGEDCEGEFGGVCVLWSMLWEVVRTVFGCVWWLVSRRRGEVSLCRVVARTG